MANLYDLLSDKDKATVDSWKDKRFNPKYKTEIPPEVYTIAEAGHYLGGWPAIEAAMRGYVWVTNSAGKKEKLIISMPMIIALCKAERKIRYRELLELGDIQTAANVAGNSTHPGKVFRMNTKEYRREAQ